MNQAHMISDFARHVQIVGLDDVHLTDIQKGWVIEIASSYAEKIQHMVKNEYHIVLHLKEYHKEGRRHKYSIHARINYPGGPIVSSRSHDWEIRTALHKAFRDIENELRHRYKINPKELPSIRKQELTL